MATGVRSGINMAHQATPSSQKALMMELKSLQEQPVEGFRITLVEESDLYNWEVAIFGPPNTLYEGGYFKVGQKKLSNTKRWMMGSENRQHVRLMRCIHKANFDIAVDYFKYAV